MDTFVIGNAIIKRGIDRAIKKEEERLLRQEMIEITIPESLEEGFDAIPATGLYERAAEFISEAIKTL